MTPATSSSAPSPNGETDMNDIDIEEGRRLLALAENDPDGWSPPHHCDNADVHRSWLEDNAAAMFDAIETGRQWETIARRLAEAINVVLGREEPTDLTWDAYKLKAERLDDALAAFRDVADRTPAPHHDGGVG